MTRPLSQVESRHGDDGNKIDDNHNSGYGGEDSNSEDKDSPDVLQQKCKFPFISLATGYLLSANVSSRFLLMQNAPACE